MILSMILSIYAWGSLIQLHFSMSKWVSEQTNKWASKQTSEWCEWASKRKSEQMNEQASDPFSPQMHSSRSGLWVSERVTHFPPRRIHPIVDLFFSQINTKLHRYFSKPRFSLTYSLFVCFSLSSQTPAFSRLSWLEFSPQFLPTLQLAHSTLSHRIPSNCVFIDWTLCMHLLQQITINDNLFRKDCGP